jgi:hypothetical protein
VDSIRLPAFIGILVSIVGLAPQEADARSASTIRPVEEFSERHAESGQHIAPEDHVTFADHGALLG